MLDELNVSYYFTFQASSWNTLDFMFLTELVVLSLFIFKIGFLSLQNSLDFDEVLAYFADISYSCLVRGISLNLFEIISRVVW